ncbi:hypothetical protein [Promicromonospora sp. MEB111]|uniref:hypothetical protein n=1 Tax=Promicromonospora sp. MEB111 TaxID=3040301 RepID=UPI00254C26A0|nr:hypothetical protein [Promicromonospora sp. MEB111]
MNGYMPGRPVLSLQQLARGRRYVAAYRERFGRAPADVPTSVYLEDEPACEELA